MKDYLLDLVSHTHDLGCIDLVKIVGDDKTTVIHGVAEDQSVVMQAEFRGPVAEFMGTFGMPNLAKLKILLHLQEYREDARLTITRKDTGVPDGVLFENAAGDFRNNYRFMSSEIVNARLKTAKFKGVNWHIEFAPTVASVMRLRMQAQANAEEPTFQVRTENNQLKFSFGDHSTHAGEFVFQDGITGQLKRAWSYPVAQINAIMSLTGDKVMRISDDGAAEITVDSGVATYSYILPAQSK
jgi:hypothetical protein